MKKEIMYLLLVFLFGLSAVLAKDSHAVVLQNIQVRENVTIPVTITVTPTVTPTPTLSVTIKPVKNILLRVALKKTNAIKEIERRIAYLNKLIEKIIPIKKITSSQKETLVAQIQVEVTKLEALKTKITNENDATALTEEKKTITESYKIYALYVPKIEIIAHADKIIAIADSMAERTKDTALLSTIADSKAKAISAIEIVMPLLPEDYPDYRISFVKARDLLKTSRTELNSVYSELKSEK